MKRLLITLILVSPFSFADWGDVYYCQMTTFSNTTYEGKRTDYLLEKFQFKLDKTKKAMVFGSTGYFKTQVLPVVEDRTWANIETWDVENIYAHGSFEEGKFLFTGIFMGIRSITANCDKF